MDRINTTHKARISDKDEFYTRYEDIDTELSHYMDFFKDKIIYCPCDRDESNFVAWFRANEEILQYKEFIHTWIHEDNTYDFRSQECIDLMHKADIIVTNPPFSLLRVFIAQVLSLNKDIIVLGNNNAIAYKDIFPYIQCGILKLGFSRNKSLIFDTPYQEQEIKVKGITWFTTYDLDINYKTVCKKEYIEEDYNRYSTYDAIDVSRITEIPKNYKGVMGVPITYLNQFDFSQFEIVGLGMGELGRSIGVQPIGNYYDKYKAQGGSGTYSRNNILCIYEDEYGNVKIPYARLLIKRVD